MNLQWMEKMANKRGHGKKKSLDRRPKQQHERREEQV